MNVSAVGYHERKKGKHPLSQPPKKVLAGEVTHRLFFVNGHKANRFDLVFSENGFLVDAVFYAIENGQRAFVDGETETVINEIISIMELGWTESLFEIVEDFTSSPNWAGGDILPEIGAKEFELNSLDWPVKLVETFRRQQDENEWQEVVEIVYSREGVEIGMTIVLPPGVGCSFTFVGAGEGVHPVEIIEGGFDFIDEDESLSDELMARIAEAMDMERPDLLFDFDPERDRRRNSQRLDPEILGKAKVVMVQIVPGKDGVQDFYGGRLQKLIGEKLTVLATENEDYHLRGGSIDRVFGRKRIKVPIKYCEPTS